MKNQMMMAVAALNSLNCIYRFGTKRACRVNHNHPNKCKTRRRWLPHLQG